MDALPTTAANETAAGHPAEPLQRIAGARPVAVCEELELSAVAAAALFDDPLPSTFLTALLVGDALEDAVRYLAHALPRSEAVRWACDCVLALRGPALSAQAQAAVVAAQRWAASPGAAEARRASAAADAKGVADEGGARFAALSAAWSADSLADEDLPPVPPPAGLGAQAVAAAVLIAASAGDPGTLRERYRQSVARGILRAREAG